MPGTKLNLIIAHPSGDAVAQIRAAVEASHTVLAECTTASGLREAVLGNWPDLLITGITYPDGDGLDTVIGLAEEKPLPSVVVTSKRSLALVEKAMQDHVMAYLIEPVQADELEAAILLAHGRFEQLTQLASEVDDLRQALADRKVIERAKGVLMAGGQVTEPDAFAALRTRAQNDRIKLVEAARKVLDNLA